MCVRCSKSLIITFRLGYLSLVKAHLCSDCRKKRKNDRGVRGDVSFVSRKRTTLFLSLIWNKHQKLSVKLFWSDPYRFSHQSVRWIDLTAIICFLSEQDERITRSVQKPAKSRKPRSIPVSIIVLPIVRSPWSKSRISTRRRIRIEVQSRKIKETPTKQSCLYLY